MEMSLPIHLKKLSVGTACLQDLQDWQKSQIENWGHCFHTTRNWPKQAESLKRSGSIYWVVKGAYLARQKIEDLQPVFFESDDKNLKPRCKIIFYPELIPVEAWPHRPFQGWRYLLPKDAPSDIKLEDVENQEIFKELYTLGIGLK